jgi:hypothetical protein
MPNNEMKCRWDYRDYTLEIHMPEGTKKLQQKVATAQGSICQKGSRKK